MNNNLLAKNSHAITKDVEWPDEPRKRRKLVTLGKGERQMQMRDRRHWWVTPWTPFPGRECRARRWWLYVHATILIHAWVLHHHWHKCGPGAWSSLALALFLSTVQTNQQSWQAWAECPSRLAKWLQNKTHIYAIYRRPTSDLETHTVWKQGNGGKVFHAYGNQKKARVAVLI